MIVQLFEVPIVMESSRNYVGVSCASVRLEEVSAVCIANVDSCRLLQKNGDYVYIAQDVVVVDVDSISKVEEMVIVLSK